MDPIASQSVLIDSTALQNQSVSFVSSMPMGIGNTEIMEEQGEVISEDAVTSLMKTIKNITTLIDLQEEDWNIDCEYVIEKFLRQPDQFILTIYFDLDELKASLGFPECRVTDLHLYYRKKFNVVLTNENFSDLVSWSTLDGNPEQTIYALMTGLQAPLMYNIKHWPNRIL
ncbi:hypothetical protein GE061_014247 [Apolygus lucorum]|uniref:Uncharacterized protein n=1 Tax=Apolygus lucorum TaxID=248454 RepID=A0A8S9XQB4_APOLU|nr:hypothetical protein GE061_014247 [Apolygus lucorum]